jgi:hypothetical protein
MLIGFGQAVYGQKLSNLVYCVCRRSEKLIRMETLIPHDDETIKALDSNVISIFVHNLSRKRNFPL